MYDINSGNYNHRANIPISTSKRSTRASPIPINSNHLYSTQAYQSPLIHTFNSEWIDSPENSPSKPSRYYSEMSSAQTGIITTNQQQKMETPMKSKSSLTFITPMSEHKVNDVISNEKSGSVSPRIEEFEHCIKSWDVFWAMLNNVTGKDKMAKVGQYTLRLLIYYANRTQISLSDRTINIAVITERYNNKEKKLNLARNFLHHPSNFIRIIVILVCSIFKSKLSGLVKGLSTYRQFLRFGKTPFRIRNFYNRFQSNFDTNKKTLNYKNLMNKSTLSEILSLYYGVNDEALLLFKLNFFSNISLRKFVARHESLAWYYDSFFGLYNAYENLQRLNQQEMDLKIQIQVKNRAKILSKQLLGGTAIHSVENLTNESDDSRLLRELQFKKYNSYLDIYKWLSDIIFNTYTVFNIALPFDTLQILMGISASSLSTVKIYRQTKKKLIEEEFRKRT